MDAGNKVPSQAEKPKPSMARRMSKYGFTCSAYCQEFGLSNFCPEVHHILPPCLRLCVIISTQVYCDTLRERRVELLLAINN